MEIYEIKVLDCTIERNRKRLVSALKKSLKIDKFPKRKTLERYIAKMEEKGIRISKVRQIKDGSLFVSLEVRRGSYSTFYANYYYEALCKAILIGNEHIKYNKRVGQ